MDPIELHIAQILFDAVDAALQSNLANNMAKVMLGVGALFGTFWLVHFTMRNILWLYQGMTGIFRDVVFEILKVAVIAGLAWNVSWYTQTVVPFVTGFPVWMGGVMSGQEGNQVNQIDAMISVYLNSLIELIGAMSFNIITTSFAQVYLGIQAVFFYLVGGIPFILVAVGTLCTLKVATTVVLSIGPLFIAFALFERTRNWFFGWVALIAGFMLTQVMFSIVLGLEISFINTVIIKNGAIDTSMAGNYSMLIYFGCFTLLATELPNYAASIMGGGSSGGVGGLGGIIGRGTGLGAATKGAKAVGNFIGSKIGNRNSIGA
ncbi:type IV secretion system protein [Pseudomonas fragariae (ex Marin et al. 2024)]|uniref:type IV secretion system protein n=1 Tax=Pseudomonas fragariae (ex Marin et al. 2024) TaxID=3080056 RepID=UPI003F79D7D4